MASTYEVFLILVVNRVRRRTRLTNFKAPGRNKACKQVHHPDKSSGNESGCRCTIYRHAGEAATNSRTIVFQL